MILVFPCHVAVKLCTNSSFLFFFRVGKGEGGNASEDVISVTQLWLERGKASELRERKPITMFLKMRMPWDEW